MRCAANDDTITIKAGDESDKITLLFEAQSNLRLNLLTNIYVELIYSQMKPRSLSTRLS